MYYTIKNLFFKELVGIKSKSKIKNSSKVKFLKIFKSACNFNRLVLYSTCLIKRVYAPSAEAKAKGIKLKS